VSKDKKNSINYINAEYRDKRAKDFGFENRKQHDKAQRERRAKDLGFEDRKQHVKALDEKLAKKNGFESIGRKDSAVKKIKGWLLKDYAEHAVTLNTKSPVGKGTIMGQLVCEAMKNTADLSKPVERDQRIERIKGWIGENFASFMEDPKYFIQESNKLKRKANDESKLEDPAKRRKTNKEEVHQSNYAPMLQEYSDGSGLPFFPAFAAYYLMLANVQQLPMQPFNLNSNEFQKVGYNSVIEKEPESVVVINSYSVPDKSPIFPPFIPGRAAYVAGSSYVQNNSILHPAYFPQGAFPFPVFSSVHTEPPVIPPVLNKNPIDAEKQESVKESNLLDDEYWTKEEYNDWLSSKGDNPENAYKDFLVGDDEWEINISGGDLFSEENYCKKNPILPKPQKNSDTKWQDFVSNSASSRFI
jgi:hypothetical protein